MTMYHTKEELAQKALKRLEKLHPLLWKFIERGLTVAKTHFENKVFDTYLFSHVVRYEVCCAIDALDPKQIELRRIHLPLSGIELDYEGFDIKVWKADGGEMPYRVLRPTGKTFFLKSKSSYLDQAICPSGWQSFGM